MTLMQQDRLVSLGTPLGKDVLLVESLEGTEAISSLFRFQLVLVSEKRDIALKDVVGQNVTIAIELPGKKYRFLNGFVSKFAQGDVDSRVSHYYAEVVPWLWFLTRTTDCRIFQRKSVPDIIKQIFNDLGLTDFKLQLQGSFEPREYCVQYRESDFNFVSRLMEEEGIFYFFEHTNAKHTLILGNDPAVHQPCPNQAQAKYGYMTGGVQDKDMITRLHIEQELQPGKFTLTDYYFQTPSNSLKVSTPSAVNVGGNGKLEVYDYPGPYAKRFDGDDKAA
jgi:type VI secretion system secreted protein VgrG